MTFTTLKLPLGLTIVRGGRRSGKTQLLVNLASEGKSVIFSHAQEARVDKLFREHVRYIVAPSIRIVPLYKSSPITILREARRVADRSRHTFLIDDVDLFTFTDPLQPTALGFLRELDLQAKIRGFAAVVSMSTRPQPGNVTAVPTSSYTTITVQRSF